MGLTLIADSGSTKTAWRGFAGNEIFLETETGGLNPVYLSEDAIRDEVDKNLAPFIDPTKVDRLYFFGAGCHSAEMQMHTQNALSLFFSHSLLHIYSDMEGAAIGLFGTGSGIACILGTGSNSCHWNGKSIESSIPALGYILGDEGSGAWMGKKIAADYLRKRLPDDISRMLEDDFTNDLGFFLKKIYQNEYASRFLASLTGKINSLNDHPYVLALQYEAIEVFYQTHIAMYKNNSLPVGFVGGLADSMRPTISKFCTGKGINNVNIVNNPLNGIQKYLTKELYPDMM